jgi:hypothetical protein
VDQIACASWAGRLGGGRVRLIGFGKLGIGRLGVERAAWHAAGPGAMVRSAKDMGATVLTNSKRPA